ncbi:hypothetical protein C8J57DRAFT_1601299 [Mycena rebaudengoi]|nr:hypothetical protein C8J57DRAFT_1601299 [Mycena rebaudengoi]
MSLDATLNLILGLTPVPGLHPAFTLFEFIVSSVQAARASQKQLAALAVALAQLLATLQREFESNRPVPRSCVQPLNDLINLLRDIHQFVQAEQDHSFLRALLHADSRVAVIELFYHRIATTSSVALVHLVALAYYIIILLALDHITPFCVFCLDYGLAPCQIDNEKARLEDVSTLAERFSSLERNHNELRRELDINNKNMLAIMVSIERRMEENKNRNSPEQNFYAHTLQYLASTTGQHGKLEDCVISPFDVDYGPKIGAGGLLVTRICVGAISDRFHSGTVYKGSWKHIEVAIKLVHDESGITANLDHPTILGDSDRAHQRRLAPVGGVVARNFDGAAQTRLGASNGPNADESNM